MSTQYNYYRVPEETQKRSNRRNSVVTKITPTTVLINTFIRQKTNRNRKSNTIVAMAVVATVACWQTLNICHVMKEYTVTTN